MSLSNDHNVQSRLYFLFCFFVHYPATTEIYTYLHTLSLHDALPIYGLLFSGFYMTCFTIGITRSGSECKAKWPASGITASSALAMILVAAIVCSTWTKSCSPQTISTDPRMEAKYSLENPVHSRPTRFSKTSGQYREPCDIFFF